MKVNLYWFSNTFKIGWYIKLLILTNIIIVTIRKMYNVFKIC